MTHPKRPRGVDLMTTANPDARKSIAVMPRNPRSSDPIPG